MLVNRFKYKSLKKNISLNLRGYESCQLSKGLVESPIIFNNTNLNENLRYLTLESLIIRINLTMIRYKDLLIENI